MRVLAIETSFDETAVAVVERAENGLVRVVAEVVASSEEMHARTGGAVPEVAAREQLTSIIPVIKEVSRQARLRLDAGREPTSEEEEVERLKEVVGAVAVTQGPGLIGSLLVGVETAKVLALAWDKPLFPVNHLKGHLFANWIEGKVGKASGLQEAPALPAVGLVVSGGHTDLVIIDKEGEIGWLGGTRDDAAGECFDKCGRLLGLPYPGGPEIARLAGTYKKSVGDDLNRFGVELPRPLMGGEGYDLSFSGLKVAVHRVLQEKGKSESVIAATAYELQEAVVDVLVQKTVKAMDEFKPKSVLLAGGVAANWRLGERMRQEVEKSGDGVKLFVPEKKYCTDNAAMIGGAALIQGEVVAAAEVKADPSLSLRE